MEATGGHEGKKTSEKNLPKRFLETIRKLGLREKDAETLYSTKINWTAVFSDNKIFCSERGCDFSTEISKDNAELQAHMENLHQWGDFPCNAKNCFLHMLFKGESITFKCCLNLILDQSQ